MRLFLWFHTMATRYLFFRWNEKNFVSTLSTRILWASAFALKSRSFSALFNTSINPSRNTCVLFLWTKVIGPGMTQAVGSHSSCVELRKLGSCVYNNGIRRWCSLSSACLYQRKQCTSKITEKFFKFFFRIFLHYIPIKKCINHCIKCRRLDK